MALARQAYFVIFDVSGYTRFLTGTEFEHAHGVMERLLRAMVDAIDRPLVISNFQGDAVLTYAPTEHIVAGQSVLDAVEKVYCAFRACLSRMQLGTTCTCAACDDMDVLDLKAFVHYGTYSLMTLGGREELSGPDVIAAHRLMKNGVVEKTGIRPYALLTDVALGQMRLSGESMLEHTEEYEHLGDVPARVHDLGKVWEASKACAPHVIEKEGCWFTHSKLMDAPPDAVWQVFVDPQLRGKIFSVNRSEPVDEGGRLGRGYVVHCYHEDTKYEHEFLDWKPYDYVTWRSTLPFPVDGGSLEITATLTPKDGGTEVAMTWSHASAEVGWRNTLVKCISAMGCGWLRSGRG